MGSDEGSTNGFKGDTSDDIPVCTVIGSSQKAKLPACYKEVGKYENIYNNQNMEVYGIMS